VLTSPYENGDRCSGGLAMTAARESTEAFEAIMSDVDPPSYVVTAAAGDDRAGCLVGFATQCSIDPPRFGVWLSKLNRTYRVARTSRTLIVHLLRDDDGDLAGHFGGETGDDVDKFSRVRWHFVHGAPVLDACDRWFAGVVLERLDLGDHVGFLLEPIDTEQHATSEQLTFQKARDIEPGHKP
jgi:flavin reductase (DIM6/NTAB) family NADH-FMN oxidoreductase RutF